MVPVKVGDQAELGVELHEVRDLLVGLMEEVLGVGVVVGLIAKGLPSGDAVAGVGTTDFIAGLFSDQRQWPHSGAAYSREENMHTLSLTIGSAFDELVPA